MNRNEIEWASFLAARRIVMRATPDVGPTMDVITAIIQEVFASVQPECERSTSLSSSVQEAFDPDRSGMILQLPKRLP